MEQVKIGDSILVGQKEKPLLFGGPCVIESLENCLEIAETVAEYCEDLGIQYVFKASFDKANRTSINSFRGPGLEKGLEILQEVKNRTGLPLVTDIHEPQQCAIAAEVVDVLQVPAFLCRQTDLLIAAGETGKTISVKKAQFIAPEAMRPVIEKLRSTGNRNILATERGSSFGYCNLVVDMRGLEIMKSLGVPVVFDATHSVQLPGGLGNATGGQREFAPVLLRAALGVGIQGMFIETHPNPDEAKSDGPNAIPLNELKKVLSEAVQIHGLVQSFQD